MGVHFNHFETERQAADALYNELRHHLSVGPEYHAEDDNLQVAVRTATSPYVVMLAGGSTPMAVYRRLAGEPPKHVHPAAHLMLSDDRYVDLHDDRSNYHHIAPLAHALGLPEERLIHVDATLALDQAVSGFGEQVAEVGRRNGVFALAILGIGSDGHTASLFSAQKATVATTFSPDTTGTGKLAAYPTDQLALSTGLHGGLERVSVGPAVLLAFRKLVFFATGAGKRDILYELSRRPEQFPAGQIMLQHPNSEIWTDEAPRVR